MPSDESAKPERWEARSETWATQSGFRNTVDCGGRLVAEAYGDTTEEAKTRAEMIVLAPFVEELVQSLRTLVVLHAEECPAAGGGCGGTMTARDLLARIEAARETG